MKTRYDKLYDEYVQLKKENTKLEKMVKLLKKEVYDLYAKLKEEGKDLDVEEVFQMKKVPFKYQKKTRR